MYCWSKLYSLTSLLLFNLAFSYLFLFQNTFLSSLRKLFNFLHYYLFGEGILLPAYKANLLNMEAPIINGDHFSRPPQEVQQKYTLKVRHKRCKQKMLFEHISYHWCFLLVAFRIGVLVASIKLKVWKIKPKFRNHLLLLTLNPPMEKVIRTV